MNMKDPSYLYMCQEKYLTNILKYIFNLWKCLSKENAHAMEK